MLQPLAAIVYAAEDDSQETTAPTEVTQPSEFVQQHPQTAYGPFSGEDESITNGCYTMDGQRPLMGSGKILDSAQAAFLYEANSQTIVYAYNPDTPMYPASLVKIMTTLIAVERADLDQIVTVTQSALDAVPDGAFMVELQLGEQMTMEQMLHCMMVGSANDAATVIAEHIAGSQENFIELMNQRAADIGCTGTVFTNVHGLHDDNQVTTARDMCRIVHEAMQNETFMTFFSTVNYTVPETNMFTTRYLETTNYLMTPGVSQIYYDSRVTGGRTGITDDLNRCLASTAEDDGMSYIIVVLGCVPTFGSNKNTIIRFGSYEETNDLIGLGFDNMSIHRVISNEDATIQFSVTNGTNDVVLSPDETRMVVLPNSLNWGNLTVKYPNASQILTAPIAAGDSVSEMQVWYGNVCLAQSKLLAKNPSDSLSDKPVINTDSAKKADVVSIVFTVIGIIALVLLVLGVVLYFIRRTNIAKNRARSRRRRKSRVRSR